MGELSCAKSNPAVPLASLVFNCKLGTLLCSDLLLSCKTASKSVMFNAFKICAGTAILPRWQEEFFHRGSSSPPWFASSRGRKRRG